MTFREMLAIVVDRTPGALAGAIMGEDGLAVQKILNGLYDSIEAKGEVRYDGSGSSSAQPALKV